MAAIHGVTIIIIRKIKDCNFSSWCLADNDIMNYDFIERPFTVII